MLNLCLDGGSTCIFAAVLSGAAVFAGLIIVELFEQQKLVHSAFIAFFPREFITNTEDMGTHQPIFDATRCHCALPRTACFKRSSRCVDREKPHRPPEAAYLGYTRARKAESKSSKAKILRDGQRAYE